MIGKFNHVAIVVPDIDAARTMYRDILGAQVSGVEDFPDHGVRVVFVELPNTTIELMTPLGEDSPVANFLARNPVGGIHHICLEVENIMEARDRLRAEGVRILGDGEPRPVPTASRSCSPIPRISAAPLSSSRKPRAGQD